MNKRRLAYIVFALLLIAVGGVLVYAKDSFAYQAAVCDYTNTSAPDKIVCWYTALDTSFKHGGAPEMIRDYIYLQTNYSKTLNPENCHAAAHWMGDLLYAKLQLSGGEIHTIEFPSEASVCTFGVLHGLFIHLFESHPVNQFVTAACTDFKSRFSNSFPTTTMGIQCYHAAGHGFVLAHAKDTPDTLETLVAAPLEQCDTLPTLNYRERQACYLGVFATAFEWVGGEQYRFSFDASHPFSLCEDTSEHWKRMCYAGIGVQFFRQPDLTPSSLVYRIAPIPNPVLRVQVFRQAMLALISRNIPTDSYLFLVSTCGTVPHDLFVACITIFPSALFNAGVPDQQYEKARMLCASDKIHALNAESICYLSIAKQLALFYPPDKFTAFGDSHVQRAIAELKESGKLTTTELDLPATK